MTSLGSKYKLNNSKKIMYFNVNKYTYTIKNGWLTQVNSFFYKILEVY